VGSGPGGRGHRDNRFDMASCISGQRDKSL
jgi:hypothetical protein